MQDKHPKPYRELLPELLKERGWSYQNLANYTNKDKSYWSRTVTGEKAVPKNEVLEELATLLNVRPKDFQEHTKRIAKMMIEENFDLATMIAEQTSLYEVDRQKLTEEEKRQAQEAIRALRKSKAGAEEKAES